MNQRTRTVLLGTVVLALGGAVIVDQRSGPGDGAGGGAEGAMAAHAREAELVGQMRASLQTAGAWESASARVEHAWAEALSRMIHSESDDIAFARFREIVQTEMADLGLEALAATAMRSASPLEDEGLRVIGLRLEFETHDPGLVFGLIDRIENVSSLQVGVEDVSIVGPGRLGRASATVSLTLRTLAWIGEAA